MVRDGDGFPPLFSLLVHWWMQVPGAEQAPRLFVALIGILGLPLMWLLGRELGGQKLGLLAAFLLAISPIHVWYSPGPAGVRVVLPDRDPGRLAVCRCPANGTAA